MPPHTRPSLTPYRPWLHRYAIGLVAATFLLVVAGGTVTSRDAGLAVPDWPTTFGHNMFLFPLSQWTGDVLWEHAHRLLGSLVGVLCIGMAAWLWVVERHRPWLRRAGPALLAFVIVQGVLGGLRVTQLSLTLAVIHGVAAQVFLCLTVLVAAATGRHCVPGLCGRCGYDLRGSDGATCPECGAGMGTPTRAGADGAPRRPDELLRPAVATALLLLVTQLTLGAVMRHTGAGLAIPDFPAHYGGLLPPFTEAGIIAGTERLFGPDQGLPGGHYPTPGQVGIHLAHRLGAVAVLGGVGWLIVAAARAGHGDARLRRPAGLLLLLLLGQVVLGAATIWTGRQPEVATAHQAVGAAVLATAVLLAFRGLYRTGSARAPAAHDDPAAAVAPGRMQGAGT